MSLLGNTGLVRLNMDDFDYLNDYVKPTIVSKMYYGYISNWTHMCGKPTPSTEAYLITSASTLMRMTKIEGPTLAPFINVSRNEGTSKIEPDTTYAELLNVVYVSPDVDSSFITLDCEGDEINVNPQDLLYGCVLSHWRLGKLDIDNLIRVPVALLNWCQNKIPGNDISRNLYDAQVTDVITNKMGIGIKYSNYDLSLYQDLVPYANELWNMLGQGEIRIETAMLLMMSSSTSIYKQHQIIDIDLGYSAACLLAIQMLSTDREHPILTTDFDASGATNDAAVSLICALLSIYMNYGS